MRLQSKHTIGDSRSCATRGSCYRVCELRGSLRHWIGEALLPVERDLAQIQGVDNPVVGEVAAAPALAGLRSAPNEASRSVRRGGLTLQNNIKA